MGRMLHFAAIGLTGLTLLMCIISCASGNWIETEAVNAGFFKSPAGSQGLWRYCIGDFCQSLEGDDRVKSVRAFTILAILALCAAIVSIILALKKDMFGILFLLASFGAGVCQLIAMAIYTDTYRGVAESALGNFGWSFVLGWIGCILAGLSCGLGILLKIMGGGES